MCRTLSGYTEVCVISFIDIYEKVTCNFPQARTVTPQERIAIGKAFAEIGQRYGITIKACAEGDDLAPYGVDCNGCMTQETFEAAIGCSLDVPIQTVPHKTEDDFIINENYGIIKARYDNMMKTIAELREKYALKMKVERYISDEDGIAEKDNKFIVK